MKIKTQKSIKESAMAGSKKSLNSPKEGPDNEGAPKASASEPPNLDSLQIWLNSAASTPQQIQSALVDKPIQTKKNFETSPTAALSPGLPTIFSKRSNSNKKNILTKEDQATAYKKAKKTKVQFGAFFGENMPLFYLGTIQEMEKAGLDKLFINLLLQPQNLSSTDKQLQAKVLYATFAKKSPLFANLKPFTIQIEKEHTKPDIQNALDEMLITASGLESPALAQLLISHGANVNAWSWEHGVSPIHVANNKGRKTIASMLEKAGADTATRENHPFSEAQPYDAKE